MEPKLEKVDGHPYSKVLSGPHRGAYVNQTHNKREGEFFRLVEKAGRVQHVYGTGAAREVLTMPVKPAAAPAPAAPGVATDISRDAVAPAPGARTTSAASSSPATGSAARGPAATGGLLAPDEA